MYERARVNGAVALDERRLSTRALKFLELLADVDDTRSIRDRAKAAGLSESYGYRLSKRPEFIKALRTRVHEVLRCNLALVYARMVACALEGDVAAARLLLQAAGELDQKVDLTVNTGGVLALGVEKNAEEWEATNP